jgi:pimeloyl-ACP methyl ester carboxylesterase
LQAPSKQLVIFEQSGHAAHHEEGEQFAAFMARVVEEASSN